MFIYWVLRCLFCTRMIPRVLFTRNLDQKALQLTQRRYRGHSSEETPTSLLSLWGRPLGDGGDSGVRLLMVDRSKGVGGACSRLKEGVLHTQPFLRCFLPAGLLYLLISSFSTNASLKGISELYRFKFLAFHGTFFWCNFIFSNMAS